MKRLAIALVLWGAFSWSPAMAQTEEQTHQHQQNQDKKDASAIKGMPMKAEMKDKMKEKMKDMQCCAKEEQKEPKG